MAGKMQDFGAFLWSAAAFILVLCPLIFLHEWGHFWVARRCGVHVESFSIGFGPEIFGWTDRRGTRWKVSWIPLGGYVKMLGDADVSGLMRDSTHGDRQEETLDGKRPWQKICIAGAGPLANYLVALVLGVALLVAVGAVRHGPVVGAMTPTSLAAQHGVRVGDRVKKIQGAPVASFEDVLMVLERTPADQPLTLDLVRAGPGEADQGGQDGQPGQRNLDNALDAQQSLQDRKRDGTASSDDARALSEPRIAAEAPTDAQAGLTRVVLPAFAGATGSWLGKLGIKPPSERWYQPLGVVASIKHMLTLMDPRRMIKSLKPDSMGGPIAIGLQAGQALQEGWITFLFFMVSISIALGFFNLLPLPILDGGAILLALAEWVTGRRLPEKAQTVIAGTTFVGLITLFVWLSWKDLMGIPLIFSMVKAWGLV